MNLPPDAVLAYHVSTEARYWPAIAHNTTPDIIVEAAVPGDGVYWEIAIEDDGSGELRPSPASELGEARAQVPELFAAMAEIRPRTLEEVRAILVHLGAEDVMMRQSYS